MAPGGGPEKFKREYDRVGGSGKKESEPSKDPTIEHYLGPGGGSPAVRSTALATKKEKNLSATR